MQLVRPRIGLQHSNETVCRVRRYESDWQLRPRVRDVTASLIPFEGLPRGNYAIKSSYAAGTGAPEGRQSVNFFSEPAVGHAFSENVLADLPAPTDMIGSSIPLLAALHSPSNLKARCDNDK